MNLEKMKIKILKRKLKKKAPKRTPEEQQHYKNNVLIFKKLFKNTRVCKVSVKYFKAGYFLLTLKVKDAIFDKQKFPSIFPRKHQDFKTQL
jgi:hypothetical protein